MPKTNLDHQITLLELLRNRPDAAQRDMAEAIGLSLGMTNLLLKQLTEKGLMLVRKINARNVQYILTPDGVAELGRRSTRYLKQAIRNVADCRMQLEIFVKDVKTRGFTHVTLVGTSDLDFVIEFLCQKHGLVFLKSNPVEGSFIIHGEGEPHTKPNLLEYLHQNPASEATT